LDETAHYKTSPDRGPCRGESGRDSGQTALEALLWGACEGWGLASATWIPVRSEPASAGFLFRPNAEPVSSGRRFRPREVDWSVLDDLVPGACQRPTRRRSPRAAAGEFDELWAAPGHERPGGVLHLLGEARRLPEPEPARALAERLNELETAASSAPDGHARDAGWAHDMRNRLTHALLGLERLRREHGAAPGAASLDEVALSLQLARTACNDRLSPGGAHADTTARRQRGAPQLLRPVILRAVQAATEIANAHADCAVRVLVRCPSTMHISADTALLHRAVENLTINALQASQAGSDVRVEASCDDGDACVTIRDEGCGMGPAELDAFRTPGRSGRSAQGGTGYGTASLFDCLGRLDAELSLETQRGAGTTAMVRWPERALAAIATEVSWSPWQQVAAIDRLHMAQGQPGPAVHIPRGAYGAHATEFLELCAQRGLAPALSSCLTSVDETHPAGSDKLTGPRRATWAARRETSVSPAS
jgi:signal transduction histidine kinase